MQVVTANVFRSLSDHLQQFRIDSLSHRLNFSRRNPKLSQLNPVKASAVLDESLVTPLLDLVDDLNHLGSNLDVLSYATRLNLVQVTRNFRCIRRENWDHENLRPLSWPAFRNKGR